MSINIKSPHEYLNATVVGTPTISEGVVSGFTSANYLKLTETFNPTSNPWEWDFKLNIGTDVSTSPYLLGCTNTSGSWGALFGINGSKFSCWLSSNGTSWNIKEKGQGATTVLAGETYYVKFGWTGSEYYIDLSTNGIDYTRDYTLTSTAATHSSAFNVGTTWNLSTTFNGSIDLNESYIKINGEYWWRGMEVDQYREIKRLYYSGSSLIKQVYKTDKPKYYKYTWEDWTQPVLTANGTLGGDSFAVSSVGSGISTYPAYGAFDGVKSGTGSLFDKSSGYLEFYNPRPLKVSSLSILNFAGDTYGVRSIKAGYIQARNDNEEYQTIKEFTNTVLSGGATWSVDLSDNNTGYKYYRIVGTDTSYTNSAASHQVIITELTITAKERVGIEVNLGGEDVYGDWEQPILTANGTMGGDSFACSESAFHTESNGDQQRAWRMFSDTDSLNYRWQVNTVSTSSTYSATWYNPDSIKITAIQVQNATGSYSPAKIVLQASNDNVSWVTLGVTTNSNTTEGGTWDLVIDSSDWYKYYRIVCTPRTATSLMVGRLKITAQELKAIGGNNYDYSVIIPQLVYEHNPTVFQQSTAGTYTFNVTEEAPYEITLVGGGGGGAFNSSGNAGSAAAGNSGSGLVVNAVLKAGTYVLNVGAGGAWSGWLDANTWGGNGSQSSISKDGVVLATAGGGTGNHAWWRSGSAHNSTVGAAPTYTDALGVRDVIMNTQGNWGGLAATSSGGASVISGTTWGKGGDTRDRNAADNGNAGCIRIVRLEK